MTPKQKAWELYHKYRTLEGKFGDKVLYNYDAKQCALIAVDEILKNQFHFRDSANYYILTQYYEQVKQEIEKI